LISRLLEPDQELRRVALRTPAGFLAFGLGCGLSRYAPGTVGTALAVPFAWLLRGLPVATFWILLAGLFAMGVYLCGVTSRKLGRHDPGGIVWDEMIGFCLTVALVPREWPWWLAAFALFRFFDILKPWPIRLVEQRVGGGLGIMLDDVIAAVFALITLAVAQLFLAG
jgi:phosphatidylglycerophosphatase A